MVTRAFYSSEGLVITEKELPQYIIEEVSIPMESKNQGPFSPKVFTGISEFERQQILNVLDECSGNVILAGKMLGMSKSTIYRRIKEYHIQLCERKIE